MMRCTNQGEPVALGIHLEKRERERERKRAPREVFQPEGGCYYLAIVREGNLVSRVPRVTISCKLLNRPGFYLDLPSKREHKGGSWLFEREFES